MICGGLQLNFQLCQKKKYNDIWWQERACKAHLCLIKDPRMWSCNMEIISFTMKDETEVVKFQVEVREKFNCVARPKITMNKSMAYWFMTLNQPCGKLSNLLGTPFGLHPGSWKLMSFYWTKWRRSSTFGSKLASLLHEESYLWTMSCFPLFATSLELDKNHKDLSKTSRHGLCL